MQAEWYKGIFLLMTFLLIKYGWMHPYWHVRRCDIHNDILRKKVQERHLYLLFLYSIKENMSLKEICPYVILSSVCYPFRLTQGGYVSRSSLVYVSKGT